MIPSISQIESASRRRDPLRRMQATPLNTDLRAMGRKIHLETNSSALLIRTVEVFARYAPGGGRQPDFRWKLVCEPDRESYPVWPEVLAFSDEGIRYVSFGQHSFVAIDLNAGQAVGYIAEGLLNNREGFISPFLNTLFILTAGALQLTSFPAACVTSGEKAIVVLGDSGNGKTTSSYLATRLGLEFYSDGAAFLDLDRGRLRLWGGFSPASFAASASTYLSELETEARPFHYRDMTFLYLENGTSIRSNGHPVIPIAYVYLERGAATTPRLTALHSVKSLQRLESLLSFRDDPRFALLHVTALRALAQVPSYHLAYGQDPAVASTFLRHLLNVHDSLETPR